jgi:nicotinamide-nucleotide amidase
MNYTAELIAVGTEILLGNIANTDAQDLSQTLSALGIDVYHHTVVGDNPQRLREALTIARDRADIIITTGGLGPTYDDMTKQTVAETFGRKLVYHPEQAERIEAMFRGRRHGMKMTENNLLQAWLPEGCTVFENSCGTAPGCGFAEKGVHVLMLPGPPRECRAMIRTGVVPYLSGLTGAGIYSRTLYIIGMGESAVEYALHDLMLEMTNPTLAPYAKEGYCLLRLTAKAPSREAADAMMAPALARIYDVLGDVIYGEDTGEIEFALVPMLREKGITAATAESCTGGLVAKMLTDVPGSSAVLRGGFVTYTDEAKQSLLGISGELLAEKGAVCREVALAMAENAAARLGADLGIGTTGVAGPDSDERGNPVGLVYIGLYYRGQTWCRELHMHADRERVRLMTALTALDMARRAVLALPIRE